jgi:hypothetical protein
MPANIVLKKLFYFPFHFSPKSSTGKKDESTKREPNPSYKELDIMDDNRHN